MSITKRQSGCIPMYVVKVFVGYSSSSAADVDAGGGGPRPPHVFPTPRVINNYLRNLLLCNSGAVNFNSSDVLTPNPRRSFTIL